MILVSFERRESQLLIDTKIDKFGRFDGKLNENSNGIFARETKKGSKRKNLKHCIRVLFKIVVLVELIKITLFILNTKAETRCHIQLLH